MTVKLISAEMLYDDALKGYQNSPVKYYRRNSSIYPHIKKLFIKAMDQAGEDFISYKTARIVTRTYYETRLPEAGIGSPEIVAKAISDFATVYNLSKNTPTKGFSLPDFSRLSDVIDFFGNILKKIVTVGMIAGIGAGIILIVGGLLLIPETSAAWPQSFETIAKMTQYANYRSAVEFMQSFKIMTGSAILLASSIVAPIAVEITSKIWNLIKDLLYIHGFMERNRIAKMVLHNTETYQKFEKAMEILNKYEQGDMISTKDSKAIKELIEDVGIEGDDFLKNTDKLKRIFLKVKEEIERKNK